MEFSLGDADVYVNHVLFFNAGVPWDKIFLKKLKNILTPITHCVIRSHNAMRYRNAS